MREGGKVALEPEMAHDGRQRRHRPPHEWCQGRQPTGVTGDDHDVGVELACSRVDRDHSSAAHHQVLDVATGAHLDLARRQPGGQGIGQRRHPAGDGPRAEPLLDVRHHPDPRRYVARLVTLGDARVQRDQAEPVVLESLHPPRQRLPAPEPVGERCGQVVGIPGAFEVLAAQHLPVVGIGLDVVGPARAETRAEPVDGPDLRRRARTAAGPTSRRRTGARAARPAPRARARARPVVPSCGTGRAPPPAAACTSARRPRRTRRAPPARAHRRAEVRARAGRPDGRAWRAGPPPPSPRTRRPRQPPAPCGHDRVGRPVEEARNADRRSGACRDPRPHLSAGRARLSGRRGRCRTPA